MNLETKLLVQICVILAVPSIVLFNTSYFTGTTVCCIISFFGFLITKKMIPTFANKLKQKGIVGKDLNKVDDNQYIPEALGIVPSSVFFVCAISFQLLFSHDSTKLLQYNAGLLSLVLMTLLGFADDILDLPWRYKMTLPFIATLPIIVAYNGGSSVRIPRWLSSLLGIPDINFLHLGLWYRVYMCLLSVFCCNSINIYSGINGLETGQSIVMAVGILVHNLIELRTGKHPNRSQHFFSLLLSIPFISCSMGLLQYNWYPSKVFVGDSFTFFAGMYFAVVGILGHFSKILLFFFLPQVLNFLWSLPQLTGWFECPKHRIPKINRKTGLLESSKNMTLLNVFLEIFGPRSEYNLVVWVLILQIFSSVVSLGVRYSEIFSNLFE